MNDRKRILNCLLALKTKGIDLEVIRTQDLYRLTKKKNIPEKEFVDPLTYNLYQKIIRTTAPNTFRGFLSAFHLAKLSFLLETTSGLI